MATLGGERESHLVDGTSCFFEDFRIEVPFATRSDALFAHICIKYKLTYSAIDVLLELFREKDFVLDEVTFATADRIDQRIAEERYKQTFTATTSLDAIRSKVGSIPLQVVTTFVDYLDGEIDKSLNRVINPPIDNIPPFKNQLDVLHTLSLVHRSWTGLAQSKIRKHLQFVKRLPLLAEGYIRHPWCGPWLQSISFPANDHRDNLHFENLLRPCGMLQRPNYWQLKSLSVTPSTRWAGDTCFASTCVLPLLKSISQLTTLEFLYLKRGSRFPPQFLIDILSILPFLRRLKHLSIENWTAPALEALPPNLILVSPPSSLRSLSVIGDKRDIPSSIASWLLETRGDYCPDALLLDVRSPTAPNGAVACLAAAPRFLSTAKKLRIIPIIDNTEFKTHLTPLFLTCTTPLALSIQVDLFDSGWIEGDIQFPQTLTTLELTLCVTSLFLLEQTRRHLYVLIARVISKLQHLRVFRVSDFSKHYGYWFEDIRLAFGNHKVEVESL